MHKVQLLALQLQAQFRSFHFLNVAVNAYRPFFHVVLALLLLASQQLGLTHVTSHLGTMQSGNPASLNVATPSESVRGEKALSQVLLDLSCEQCYAFAQTASPLVAASPSLPNLSVNGFIATPFAPLSLLLQMQSMYQSRAPPAHLQA